MKWLDFVSLNRLVSYAGGKRMKAALPNIEVMQSEAELEVDEDDSYTYI